LYSICPNAKLGMHGGLVVSHHLWIRFDMFEQVAVIADTSEQLLFLFNGQAGEIILISALKPDDIRARLVRKRRLADKGLPIGPALTRHQAICSEGFFI